MNGGLCKNVVCFLREHHIQIYTHTYILKAFVLDLNLYLTISSTVNRFYFTCLLFLFLSPLLSFRFSTYYANTKFWLSKKFILVALDSRITFSFTWHVSNCIYMQFRKRNILLYYLNCMCVYCSIKLIRPTFTHRCDH